MIKVLIIDDEPMICKGLSDKINWKSFGCTVCGIAMNGLEGKKKINELKPDIVISDIIMPGCTGLELAEYVHEFHKDIIMVLLSGYDEFSFAKEALKYNVFDYILKPTDKEEVMIIIKKAINVLNRKRNQQKNYQHMESIIQTSKPILEQSLLRDIVIKGTTTSQNFNQGIDSFDRDLGKGAVVTIKVFSQLKSKLTLKSLEKSIAILISQEKIDARLLIHDRQIIILSRFPTSMPNSLLETRLKDLAKNILVFYLSEEKFNISIGIGGIYTSLDTIHNSYLQSVKALSKSFFTGQGKLHLYNDDGNERFNSEFNGIPFELYQLFEERDHDLFLLELEKLFTNLRLTYDKQLVLNQCLELFIKLMMEVRKWDPNYKFAIGYEQMQTYKTFEDLKDFVKSSCLQMKEHLSKQMNKNNLGIVERAKKIIKDEYANPDISIQFIADQLHVSLGYLSRSFKKETGQNLSQYLTEVRVGFAEKLLSSTDLKVHEIAREVGFLDARYFGQVFKRVTKLTPSDYKESKN